MLCFSAAFMQTYSLELGHLLDTGKSFQTKVAQHPGEPPGHSPAFSDLDSLQGLGGLQGGEGPV